MLLKASTMATKRSTAPARASLKLSRSYGLPPTYKVVRFEVVSKDDCLMSHMDFKAVEDVEGGHAHLLHWNVPSGFFEQRQLSQPGRGSVFGLASDDLHGSYLIQGPVWASDVHGHPELFLFDASAGGLDGLLTRIAEFEGGAEAIRRFAHRLDTDEGDANDQGAPGNLDLLRAAGDMLTASEVAERLRVTRQAVHEALKERRLLGLRFGSRWRFPSAQFTDAETVPGLSGLLRALGDDVDGWRAMALLLAPGRAEDERPLELLRKGRRAAALAALLASSAERPPAEADALRRGLDDDLEADLRREEEQDRRAVALQRR